jgi:3'-phosphoadenosine 5'-phosphosulfate sulfotransferase (PAPS reductase)/FAD synthetase
LNTETRTAICPHDPLVGRVFLSLGAGVQSTVLLMLAIRGEIERPDHVIFADTGFEPAAVYRHVEWCRRQSEKAGIPFHVVKAPLDMREDFEAFERGDKKYFDARPPLYVTQCGEVGNSQARRQCTDRAKIRPVQRKQIELLGRATARGLPDGIAITMVGISTDEARRAAPSREKWIDRVFPLIDPLKMSRADCQAWWEKHYPHVRLVASSCVICPYKTPAMWAAMKRDQPEDWMQATEYDARMRAAYELRTGQSTYLHRDFLPLDQAELNEGQGSLALDDEIYCAGGCGL